LFERFAVPSAFAPSKKVTEPEAKSPLKEGWTAAIKAMV